MSANPSPLTLQFSYTPSEYVRGMRASYDHLARIGLTPALALIGLLTAIVSLAMTHPRPSPPWATAQILLNAAFGVAFALIFKFVLGYLGLRIYRSKPRDWQTLTVRASGESLELDGLGRTIVAPWERIRRLDQRDDLYLIVLPNRSVHFLPERPLAEQGLLEAFRTLAEEKLGSRAHLSSRERGRPGH